MWFCKAVYALFALGSFYLGLLAFTNLWFSVVILVVSPIKGLFRIFASLLGCIGFVSAWITIFLLPVFSAQRRRELALGIIAGFLAVLLVFFIEDPLPYQMREWISAILLPCALGGPVLVGICLLIELLKSPNKTFKLSALRSSVGRAKAPFS